MRRTALSFATTLAASGFLFADAALAQVHVNHLATGADDGTSWNNAFVDLQTAPGAVLAGASPTVRNCVFQWDHAARGAAVYNWGGSPTFSDCVFEQNLVWWNKGAGIHNNNGGSIVVTDCEFNSNITGGGDGNGGGAGIFSELGTSVRIERTVFRNNLSKNYFPMGDYGGAYGAAIYNGARDALIQDCEFYNNFSHAGSGVYNGGDNLSINNCLFVDNTAVSFPQRVVGTSGTSEGRSQVSLSLLPRRPASPDPRSSVTAPAQVAPWPDWESTTLAADSLRSLTQGDSGTAPWFGVDWIWRVDPPCPASTTSVGSILTVSRSVASWC